jgi:heme/copper-type cytochrome/quinol oxidase subunit 3
MFLFIRGNNNQLATFFHLTNSHGFHVAFATVMTNCKKGRTQLKSLLLVYETANEHFQVFTE